MIKQEILENKKIIWCSNKEESKKLVEHCKEKGIKWFDGTEFKDMFKKGGVGYNVSIGCYLCKEQIKPEYEVVNFEEAYEESKGE